mmetsp:Transcript_50872/g.132228  ORF Transcript_50872/g.132228 Transcript_50872/m.132228 type:complete len:219 (-) Transcript_50872:177-833(-)
MPRVLVLDCGGITNPDCEAGNDAVAAAMGVSSDAARYGHKKAWAESRSNPEVRSYWMTAFEVAGVPTEDRTPERVAACEAALGQALAHTYTETIEVAQQLKEKGVLIGIISNHLVMPPLFEYCAQGAGLRELVSDPSLMIVSQAVGLGKPDLAIYRLFFERVKAIDSSIVPADLLFVDDKVANVDAAQVEGWQGLVYNAAHASPGALAAGCAERGFVC